MTQSGVARYPRPSASCRGAALSSIARHWRRRRVAKASAESRIERPLTMPTAGTFEGAVVLPRPASYAGKLFRALPV